MKVHSILSAFSILALLAQATTFPQTFCSRTSVSNVTSFEIVVDRCWLELNCPLAQILQMNMTDRLAIVQYMQTRFQPLQASAQFRSVEGVIRFFINERLGTNGTWFSFINAVILEAIQRGGAIALDLSTDTGGNQGAPAWAAFFNQTAAGLLIDRNLHDPAWAAAEQSAIDYAMQAANTFLGVEAPSIPELQWVQYTQLFGVVMQYRPIIDWVLRGASFFTIPAIGIVVQGPIDWLTDVTNSIPGEFIGRFLWRLSSLNNSTTWEDPLVSAQILQQTIMEALEAYRQGQ